MRKLATAAAVSLALASSGAIALGLGDIEMQSALNQPMNAEIRLTSVKPGEADGMIVQLATAEAFSRAGIERTNVLKDLRFRVDPNNGAPIIRITSNKPVVEPFLNFLLEVDWPAGRMVREYTVLLDPPVFMTPNATSRNSAADQPVLLDRSEQSLIAPAPIDRNTNAAVTDAFDPNSVVVVGTAEEVADNAFIDSGDAVALDSLNGGDVVELFGVNETDAAADDGLGEAVVLSDLDAVNTDAVEFSQNQSSSAIDDYQFDVQVMADGNEVSDSYVDQSAIELNGSTVSFDNGESEIVSLDSLEPSTDSAGKEVTVKRGDTLMGIATTNAVTGATAQQMMIALLNANQSSFIQNNVNLVKAGSILRIPESSDIQKFSQSEALAQLSEQNQLWQEYRDQVRSNAGTKIATANTGSSSTAAANTASDNNANNANTDAAENTDGLSAEARKIIESARNEVLNRDELKIVAAGDETTTAASATADNSQTSEDASIGEINRKLQLAREELASTRLESTDLSEQSDELKSTTENLESLVSVRQNEVARLQAQLKDATEQSALDDAKEAANSLATNASDAAGNVTDAAGNALGNAGDAASELAGNASSAMGDAAGGASDTLGGAASSVGDAGSNALTAAGEQLDQVELVPEAQEQAAATEIAAPRKQTPWYTELLQKYGKWLVMGIGALSALFAGLLLFKKRKRRDDEILDYGDDVEFFDDDDVELHAEIDADNTSSGIGSAVATGAAGAAAVGGAAMAMGAKADEQVDEIDFGSETQAVASAVGEDGIDADDTISEVDAYLTYGLHSQAEELLHKAIEREPNNPSYSMKLMETYHAQGNADGFNRAAENYRNRFGDADEQAWAKVSAMGQELQPNNALYAGAAGLGAAGVVGVSGAASGGFSSEPLQDSDFLSSTSNEDSIGSISRDFSTDSVADEVDETALMDQSLDPAFAFDETDLEATGDFSKIADELAEEEGTIEFPELETPDVGDAVNDLSANVAQKAENLTDDGSLDFPDFDTGGVTDSIGDVASAGKDKLSTAGAAVTGGIGAAAAGIAGGAGALASGLGDKASDAKDAVADSFDDALSLDEFELGDTSAESLQDSSLDLMGDASDTVGSVAEDLTLDLDQLSGDLDMDTTSLLDGGSDSVSELEIPDLTSDNELLSTDLAGSDEMDTMMDLAKAYIDMGDKESASSALGEIVKGGSPAQVSEAETLLRKIS